MKTVLCREGFVIFRKEHDIFAEDAQLWNERAEETMSMQFG